MRNLYPPVVFLLISAGFLIAADTSTPGAAWNMTEFLVWLGTSSGASAAASFILERMAWFQKLLPDERSKWVLSVSVTFALSSAAVLTFVPKEFLTQATPWFQVVYGVVFSWIVSQLAHKADPAAAKK